MAKEENPVAQSKRENLINFREALDNLPSSALGAKQVKTVISATLDQWDRPIVDGSPAMPEDTLIRHYVSLSQFLSIIEKKSLWLSSVAGFDDDLEGALTERTKRSQQVAREKVPTIPKPQIPGNYGPLTRDINATDIPSYERDYCLVNCWRMGEDESTYNESAVFWNAYIPDGVGVAIESRIGKLKDQFAANAKGKNPRGRELGETVGIAGAVRYVDSVSGYTPIQYPQRLLWKRNGFRDEKEYRIVLDTFNHDILKSIVNDSIPPEPPSGEYIDIHPPSLVENVYLSPNAPGYLFECLECVMDRYRGLSGDMISWSELRAQDPTY